MRGSHGKEHTTIIKRASRKNHEAFHGGAWKVAFADFTLAMMALFMVMWIMGAVTEEERREIVSQLNGESLFEGNSLTPITQPNSSGGKIAVRDKRDSAEQRAAEDSLKTTNQQSDVTKRESQEKISDRSKREIEELARVIMKITSAYDAQSNLKIEVVPQGLRILITDDKKREMFQRSSAILTPFFKRLLTEFAPTLNMIDNKIIITGHTDATLFRDQELYNNWNLSSERAMEARNVLTHAGLKPTQVMQVSGMADQLLIDPEHPLNASNRRIEIMVLTQSASDSLYKFFGPRGEIEISHKAEEPSKNT